MRRANGDHRVGLHDESRLDQLQLRIALPQHRGQPPSGVASSPSSRPLLPARKSQRRRPRSARPDHLRGTSALASARTCGSGMIRLLAGTTTSGIRAPAYKITRTLRPCAVVTALHRPTNFGWKRSEEMPVFSTSAMAMASSTATRPVPNTPLRQGYGSQRKLLYRHDKLANTATAASALFCAS